MPGRNGLDPSASIKVMGPITLIALTHGYVAVIDTTDLEIVEGHHWYAKVDRTNVYARRAVKSKGKTTHLPMHRAIAGAPKGVSIDHEDGNGIHNCRANIRVATTLQNNRNTRLRKNNTSGLKGVSKARGGRWAAHIKTDGKVRFLGNFLTKEAAHARYLAEAKLHFGEFARAS